MGLSAARLNLRLLIDGIEVPVVGARCTFPDGGAATAEIQVIATDLVWDLPPRSLVTLFYFDSAAFNGEMKKGVVSYYAIGPKDPRCWKLLFMGEIAGIAFQKQDSQRSALLSCVDLTSYWDFLKQHYVNFQNGGVELFENAFLGVKMDRIKNYDVITKDMQSNLLTTLLRSKVTVDGKSQPSLYLGVHRLINEQFFAANNFYARAYNRLRMNDLVVGLPQDTTAAKLFRLEYFQKFINNQIGGAGGMVTARQMVDLLLGSVFHTYTTIPCPMFDASGTVRGFNPDINTDTMASEIIDRNAYKGATLNYTVIKPDAWFLTPPVCNVLFPHQYSSVSYQRNYLAEPTRLFMRTSLFFTGADKWLCERFYAPDFAAFDDFVHLNNTSGGFLGRLSKVLLPHEDQVGINAIMDWQPDIGAYVAKGARREYLSKVADYSFWKARFAQRNLNVSGPFNPNVIPGYPGVVMDRVGSGTDTNRHFIGHVQTIVHSIDQSGGWTYLTMTGVRVQGENIDFDGKGRSLEEITSRGTDGFMDDRYDLGRIGKEVYTPLFGCGSITDSFGSDALEQGLLNTEMTDQVKKVTDTFGEVCGSISAMELLYRTVATTDGSPETWASMISRRPKADFVQVVGLGTTFTEGEDEESALQHLITSPDFTGAGGTDPLQGFMGVAMDPLCGDMANDSYVVKTKSTEVIGYTQQPKTESVFTGFVEDAWLGMKATYVDVALPMGATAITKTTYKVGSTGKYELKKHLETRQATVKAYLDSLSYRGLRG